MFALSSWETKTALPLKEPGNLAARMTIACAMATSTEDGDGTETTQLFLATLVDLLPK
jgi:hypothetical protein